MCAPVAHGSWLAPFPSAPHAPASPLPLARFRSARAPPQPRKSKQSFWSRPVSRRRRRRGSFVSSPRPPPARAGAAPPPPSAGAAPTRELAASAGHRQVTELPSSRGPAPPQAAHPHAAAQSTTPRTPLRPAGASSGGDAAAAARGVSAAPAGGGGRSAAAGAAAGASSGGTGLPAAAGSAAAAAGEDGQQTHRERRSAKPASAAGGGGGLSASPQRRNKARRASNPSFRRRFTDGESMALLLALRSLLFRHWYEILNPEISEFAASFLPGRTSQQLRCEDAGVRGVRVHRSARCALSLVTVGCLRRIESCRALSPRPPPSLRRAAQGELPWLASRGARSTHH